MTSPVQQATVAYQEPALALEGLHEVVPTVCHANLVDCILERADLIILDEYIGLISIEHDAPQFCITL